MKENLKYIMNFSFLLMHNLMGRKHNKRKNKQILADFIKQDVSKLYRDLLPYVKITLVEAGPALLGPFDAALQNYAHSLFQKRDIDVRLGTAVTGVEDTNPEGFHFPARQAMLSDGTSLEFGTMVWSAGLAPRTFTQTLNDVLEMHPRNKRILVDNYLRVKGYEGSIWACGDAAVNEDGVPLPQLAQVARQQGIYLANVMNGKQRDDEKEFHFFSLGSMAYVGDLKGIYDGSTVGEPGKEIQQPRITGLIALLMWRFAYWGRQTSIVNKMLIPMHWFKSFLFGRGKFLVYADEWTHYYFQSEKVVFLNFPSRRWVSYRSCFFFPLYRHISFLIAFGPYWIRIHIRVHGNAQM